MIKNEIGKNTKKGKDLWKSIKSGEAMPDDFLAATIHE
jgi:hypothetical protein